ncbi:MAG: S-layer homology domain-containing protein [Clostridia bacterium]|nr:S-layer homology domain-containing protein [Clostridia bacterium]
MKKFLAVILTLVFAVSAFPLYAANNASVAGFSDVTENKWYAEAVAYVAEKELMTGTSATTFDPSVTLTRAMTVQILAQIAGADLSAYTETDFVDVPAGKWYTSSVAWADENEIATGISDDTFGYKNPVTREQLALMICKFAEKYGIVNLYPTPTENADGFADADKIHSWAKEGVDWAVKYGMISGMGNGNLDPRGTATRAQAAQIFYNLDYLKDNSYLPPDTADFDALTVEESTKTRIVCWGDSLTAGGGASATQYAYPRVLATISGLPVRNYGVGGETSGHIASRQGARAIYVAPVIIPADTTSVEVQLLGDDMEPTDLGLFGNAGLSPFTIAGVKGKFFYNESSGKYFFTRNSGTGNEEVVISRPTRVVTAGMEGRTTADINVIFSGSNNGYSANNINKLIDIERQMIEFSGSDKYVIIGMTCLDRMPDIAEINAKMADAFGDNFLDIRTYFLTEGLADAGIEPTAEDLADIERGEIPSSLRADEIHGNDIFYRLLAEQVYEKILELGYAEPKA